MLAVPTKSPPVSYDLKPQDEFRPPEILDSKLRAKVFLDPSDLRH